MKKPEHYRDDCNRIACIYDPLVRFISSFFGGEAGLRRLTIDKMDLKPGQKVLDVCCGTGTLCAMIAKEIGSDGEVVGVDLSENMLKKAENKSEDNIRFCYANAEEIPYADGYFDRASVTFGLHEMPHPVRMNVLREMRRVLKPGGKITVLDYAYPKRTLAMPLFRIWMLVEGATAMDFIQRDLSSMIRDAGFDVIEQNVYWMNTIRIVSGENADR
ncbi:MAG: methyltransferase domain-containing protein [Methanosarcinales archaeon]|nr:methyltransferase domain-containing protein [Methanosarcinales archaeon]